MVNLVMVVLVSIRLGFDNRLSAIAREVGEGGLKTPDIGSHDM